MESQNKKFNTHYEMNEINKTLKEIFKEENNNILNGNDSSLMRLDNEVLEMLVSYWYNFREKEIFTNKNGVEIDEFLNVEEYKF
jgi:hypothetical protein